jgi:hypothetical protein
MAKDPAFLFYDGDACRDMAHMNRLERGAYTDIIIAQRKFGRLSLDLIKKILGVDFESCWGAIEITLTVSEGAYYIEWLDMAIIRRKEYSETRKKNRNNKKVNENIVDTSITHVNHTENEIVNENIIVNEIIKVSESENENENEKRFLFEADPDVTESWDLTKTKFFTDTAWEESVGMTKNMTRTDLRSSMQSFIDDLEFKGDKKNLYAVRSHFINKINKVQLTPKKDEMLGTLNVTKARQAMEECRALDMIEALEKEGRYDEADSLRYKFGLNKYDDILGRRRPGY